MLNTIHEITFGSMDSQDFLSEILERRLTIVWQYYHVLYHVKTGETKLVTNIVARPDQKSTYVNTLMYKTTPHSRSVDHWTPYQIVEGGDHDSCECM